MAQARSKTDKGYMERGNLIQDSRERLEERERENRLSRLGLLIY